MQNILRLNYYAVQHSLNDHVIFKIKNILASKNVNQNDLAANLDMTRQTVSNYLTKRTEFSLNMVERFAQALSVPVAYLLTDYVEDVSGKPFFVNEPLAEYQKNPEWQTKYIELQERLLKSQEERLKILEEERKRFYDK
jgi:transcriptional regulator with XRE-family HTH domain